MNKKLIWLAAAFATILGSASAQEGPLRNEPPAGTTPDQIIQKFAAKELEFKQARENYTYRQSVKVQTLDGDTPNGEYQEIMDVQFDDKGRRLENVVFAPQPDLKNVEMDQGDFEDIRHRYPFTVTSDELPLYQIIYVGQQKEDELETYVFDVAPKQLQKAQRYFQGRIWVDQQDLQIVKSHGKPVYLEEKKKKNGEEHLYPAFTTYREQIDGRYWFPTYTRADEVLHFTNQDVHIRIVVKYTDYKRFGSKTRIIYGGEEIKKDQPKPQQQPPPPQESPK
jgi:hypothetical protein